MASEADSPFRWTQWGAIQVGTQSFPLWTATLGTENQACPGIGFIGGVHGLEWIGSEVVLAFMRSLSSRLKWDALLRHKLTNLHLAFFPVVNPGGLILGTRANPNGVDLMRNAPLDAEAEVPYLIGGQRHSARLPWYRGEKGAPMQAESGALCDFVRAELLHRPFSLVLDCHSGFGLEDRIWFPYAWTDTPFEHLPEIHALTEIYEDTYVNHRYRFEPQCTQYNAHGDLWDFLYLESRQTPHRTFIPLTLEMGSWLWVKKNPRQLFSRHGIFNPKHGHRLQRVLRRHISLMEFLCRATHSAHYWLPAGSIRQEQTRKAMDRWYPEPPP